MRNIEALRNYFLGKDPQLEVVLSDNSLRLCGIEGKHYILRGELIKRLTDLKTAMEEADETLQDNIDAEALARSQEDNTLDGKITQEANTRSGADGLLTNMINTVAGNLNTLSNNVYTKAQVDYLINEIPKFDIEIVQSLPTQDISETTIYLVPNGDNPLSGNGYEEYIYIDNNWELIGTTNIDLSDYYTKEEVDELIEENSDIKELTSPVTIWDLEDGVYLLPASCEVRYGGGTYWAGSKALLFVGTENTTTKRYFIFSCVGTENNIVNGTTTANSGTIKYFSVSSDYETTDNKVTSISQSSTNTQYPSALAVYNAIQTALANNKFKLLKPSGEVFSETQNIYDLSEGTYMICQLTDATLLLAYSGGRRPLTFTPENLSLLMVDSSHNYKYLSADGSTYYYGLADASSGTMTEFVLDDFTGTDGTTAGTSGLVPAPATTDDGKFLCADGTWQTAGGGSNITYGTTDLTPGVSQLDEGSFYFQYE